MLAEYSCSSSCRPALGGERTIISAQRDIKAVGRRDVYSARGFGVEVLRVMRGQRDIQKPAGSVDSKCWRPVPASRGLREMWRGQQAQAGAKYTILTFQRTPLFPARRQPVSEIIGGLMERVAAAECLKGKPVDAITMGCKMYINIDFADLFLNKSFAAPFS